MTHTQIATIATDDHHTLPELRASVGTEWTFLSGPGRTVQKDLDIREYTHPDHNAMIPHTLVLSVVTREIGPDWGSEHPWTPRRLEGGRLLALPRVRHEGRSESSPCWTEGAAMTANHKPGVLGQTAVDVVFPGSDAWRQRCADLGHLCTIKT